MQPPLATYRLQFCPEFGFEKARQMVGHLAALGISHIYASPIFAARPGSQHGYDVVDPNRINPELGSEAEFDGLFGELERHEMGWIQDIVPNHMAFHQANPFLMDLLESGADSAYRHWFDIDWEHPDGRLNGRLMAPFLGRPYAEALQEREIRLQYGESGFSVRYLGLRFPVHYRSYGRLLSGCLERIRTRLGPHPHDNLLVDWLQETSPPLTGPQRQALKERLWNLYATHEDIKELIDAKVLSLMQATGSKRQPDALDPLLRDQTFLLTHWKSAHEWINYRRFFTINEMICLRIESEDVFAHTHRLILSLCREGRFHGLRIDHIDGLYDPAAYLSRLREQIGDRYLVVEKILGKDEDLPADWPVQGATGYEFTNALNGIFCDPVQAMPFSSLYARFSGQKQPPQELTYHNKRLIIQNYMNGDIDNLTRLFLKVLEEDPLGRDLTFNGTKRALVELMACFPIYRTYAGTDGLQKADRPFVRAAFQKAKKKGSNLLRELEALERVLLLKRQGGTAHPEKKRWLHFAMRFQQFTGPLMAKGFEDTTLYVYGRLTSINEVGGDLAGFGRTAEAWHHFNHARQSRWPLAMNATATHDTKRGEDVRARINVLSEIAKEWESHLLRWHAVNKKLMVKVHRQWVPSKNEEYFLYQTLIGAFPFSEQDLPEFIERIQHYMVKAQREAKVYTDWIDPNPDHESALGDFIAAILASGPGDPFLDDFRPFQRRVAHFGMINSLSQVLIKISAPGVPDFYQGTEVWDLSLVDPDNRRPVDYDHRRKLLDEIREGLKTNIPGLLSDLWSSREDGRIKLFLIHQALRARRSHRQLFEQGAYQAVGIAGRFSENVLCFARRHHQSWSLTVIPRFLTRMIREGQCPVGSGVWQDTCLNLPEGSPSRWREAISGQEIRCNQLMPVSEALGQFPVALMISEEDP